MIVTESISKEKTMQTVIYNQLLNIEIIIRINISIICVQYILLIKDIISIFSGNPILGPIFRKNL